MTKPGAIERIIQTRIIKLFHEKLGCEYLGNRQVRKPESTQRYSPKLDTPAKRAFYDNLGSDEGLAVSLDEIIRKTKKADWRGDLIKEREVKRAIRSLVSDPDQVEKIFELAKNQQEY